MKKSIALFVFVTLIFASYLLAQKTVIPFAQRWEKVTEFAKKQLPESALKEVEAIFVQAQKENNSVEMIKATVYKMRFTLDKNPDEAPALICDFEAFTEKATDPAERALLHSMTAELYMRYYQKDSWTINNRTVVNAFVPDDMKEWTKNIYIDKISVHLAASLQNPAVLQATDALKFAALMEKGVDSRVLQPTLFDFLGNRKLSILKELRELGNVTTGFENDSCFADLNDFITLKLDTVHKNQIENQFLDTYQSMLAFRLKVQSNAALMNLDLERLEFFRSDSETAHTDSLYLVALNRLGKQYRNHESVVEVLAEQASYYLDKVDRFDGDDLVGSSELSLYKRMAYDICADGIKRFPKYKRIGLLENIQREITKKNVNISYTSESPFFSDMKVKVLSTNVSKLKLSVYRVNASALEYADFYKNKDSNIRFPKRTLIETRQIAIQTDQNFGSVESAIFIKAKAYGIFDFTLEEIGNEKVSERTNGTFVVTDLAYMGRSNNTKKEDVYVLNRQTGEPQKGVEIKIYAPKWMGSGYTNEFKGQVSTDKEGKARFAFDSNYYQHVLFFSKGKDCYFSSNNTPNYNERNRVEREETKVTLFTDRAIYRPGQTVFFKGIGYRSNNKKQTVTPHATFEVSLLDANNQKVVSKQFMSNEFGSFSGEFILPEGGLNGAFSIQTQGGTQSFWVEEYKRPTFEVKIERPKNEIQFGDKVTLTGIVKAYAGYNIGNANVTYRIVRRVHHFCWWINEPQEEILNGTAKSNKDGAFELTFVPLKSKSKSIFYADRAYSYTIYAQVTDPKGETQQAEQTISVSDKSLFILAEVPEKINKNENVALEISTQTINDEKINSELKYSLCRLIDTDSYAEKLTDNKGLKDGEQVLAGRFETKNKKLELDLKKLNSGRYKLVFTTLDAHGKEVKLEKVFILFSTDDKRPPVKSYVWIHTPKTECVVGEKALIQFGTSTKNTFVLYEVMRGNTLLESRWMSFSDKIKTFEIPFLESYGSGVTVLFTFMKEEQLFTRSIQLTRKTVQKKLMPSLSVFRDKLQPGEKAEWTVTIPETVKENKAAELLVGMYDASLDAIRPHSWNFNPDYAESVLYSPSWEANLFDSNQDDASFGVSYVDVYAYQLNQLNWFGLELGERYYRHVRAGALRSSVKFTAPVIKKDEELSELKSQDEINNAKGVVSIACVVGGDDVNGKDIAELKAVANPTTVRVRSNFNETAFFYPQLHTDALGNVRFSFTAPESLTRWNVKMLAHTQDLYFGQGEAQVVTQKDLMVQMNLPRFVRRSDKMVLSANVVNLTDKVLNADVSFTMIDPATDKLIVLKNAALKNVSLMANETKAVEWELNEFSPYELVICKVVAQAGNFSDGEQKYLPVLPDKIMVTESLPLTIRNHQTRTFNFESLLKNASTVESKNLTVEFSSNPAWYAVQALPSISVPESDNALDYFTAYYSNTMAGYIAHSNPKLALMFDRWKNASSSRAALLSNLEKNSELKNVLLDETPWVMAAKNETEQKRQIALLFDINRQKNVNQQYWEKLISLQMPSGGFSWFKNMPESRYMTQEILLNLARLNRLTNAGHTQLVASVDAQQALSDIDIPTKDAVPTVLDAQLPMISKALTYLDLEMAGDFDRLKKYNKNYEKEMSISNIQLFYLHLRSEYPTIPIHVSAQEAVRFYTAQSEKYWTSLSLYGKAMMAVVAQRNGKIQLASNILKSLKETAMKTDELGMYWAANRSGYYWNERPIAIQSAMIEAFAEISKNTAEVDELKIWLLKQKQTQRWDSPMATVDAIYALLYQGNDWLSNEGSVKIKLGNTLLQPGSTEAGTGYFKQVVPVADIRSEMGKVTVSSVIDKSSNTSAMKSGIAWGAMYWQYYQDLDKVQGQGGSLKITKKLFVEKIMASGKTMLPIEQTKLTKGDKVITRLVITTDRDLEFVALKDLRASCFEPVDQRSGCEWKEGVCYYQTTKDASTQFFFSFLPKGTYVFEYELWANAAGEYTSGIASVQCQYAPEFVSHTGGERVKIGRN